MYDLNLIIIVPRSSDYGRGPLISSSCFLLLITSVFSHEVLWGFLIYRENNSVKNSFHRSPIKAKLNTKDEIAFSILVLFSSQSP